jgi:predicted MPP superfamily phosphohydrolase
VTVEVPSRMTLESSIALGVAGAVVMTVALIALFAFREARNLGVERDTLHVPDLPASLDGTTLAFLADIHAGPIYGTRRMAHLVELVNGLRADVIVLGGDYVGGRNGGAAIFYPAASCLHAKRGVFAVLGNHDEWEGIDRARAGMAEAGITLLENSSACIAIGDATLAIAGLADEWTGSPDVTAAAAGIEPGDVAILVAHNPDSFADALPLTPGTWALALAGHTHGGQFAGVYRLNPQKPTRYGKRYLRRGLTEDHGVPLIVSNGIGAVALPLRFFARPEVHLVTLSR